MASLTAAGETRPAHRIPPPRPEARRPALRVEARHKAGHPPGTAWEPLSSRTRDRLLTHPPGHRGSPSKKPFPRRPQGHPPAGGPHGGCGREGGGGRRPGLGEGSPLSAEASPVTWERGLTRRAGHPTHRRPLPSHLCHPRQPSQSEPLTILSCPLGSLSSASCASGTLGPRPPALGDLQPRPPVPRDPRPCPTVLQGPPDHALLSLGDLLEIQDEAGASSEAGSQEMLRGTVGLSGGLGTWYCGAPSSHSCSHLSNKTNGVRFNPQNGHLILTI